MKEVSSKRKATEGKVRFFSCLYNNNVIKNVIMYSLNHPLKS